MFICRDFMQGLFHQFSEEEQYKPRNIRSIIFCNLRSNVISFLCSEDFDWDGGNGFFWRRRSPSKRVKKTLISRQRRGYFCTLDLTHIFE